MITVLGPTGVDGDGFALGPRERVVLAALAAYSGVTVTASALADALWASPPASWRKVVQGCVVRLRKRLGATAIETTTSGYRLMLPADQIDAQLFEHSLRRARELLVLGDPDRASFVVTGALDLWRGRALEDVLDWDRGRIEGERLEELRLEAEELRVEALLQAGRFREVLADAQRLIAEQPLRENRWALLAMALYQAGRQGDALHTLHQARRTLVDELGLDPGPQIVELEDAILTQDPSLIPVPPSDPSPVCPYRGLRPFDDGDRDAFFGRDDDIAECLQILETSRVLAVLGPSGSGKSSLVRAGLCAAIERPGLPLVVVSPGRHPMDALASLPDADTSFALVVDQCEEAMTLCKDPVERDQFFDALVSHADRNHLIVVLRADRLGELSNHPDMARLVQRGLHLLKPMDESNLRTAIEAPARQAGLLLEPGLVDLLVRDVEGEPGYLPLLSHALREVWERREGNTLTVAGYKASGGITAAVAQTAEGVYESATEEQRRMLRDLLLRLVAPNSDGEPIRTRVARRLLARDGEYDAMVEKLVEARLLTGDEDTIELSHEAVARAWPRLRTWLDDDLDGQRIWRHLAVAAGNWDTMGRPASELYRGARLVQTTEWVRTAAPDVNTVERDFLEASELLASEEENALRDQMRRQARANRRLRLAIGGVALLAVIAAGALLAARSQANRADAQAVQARSNELAASAIGVMEDDPSLAKLLAVSAATTGEAPTVEAMSALHRSLSSDLVAFRYGATFDVGFIWTDLDPSGDRFVISGTGPTTSSSGGGESGAGQILEVVDAGEGRVQWSFDLSQDLRDASAFVGSPFFTSEGEILVAGVFWDPYNGLRLPVPFEGVDPPHREILGAHLWDADNGQLIERHDLGRCGGIVVGVSDEYLLAKTLVGTGEVLGQCNWAEGGMGVELVNRRTREATLLSSAANGPILGAAMSGDGRRVAFDDGEAIVVVDSRSGDEIMRTDGRGVRDLNQDGSLLLAGIDPIEVWRVATGEVVTRFSGHTGGSLFARFGPENTVLSTGADGALRQWDAGTGVELFSYPGLGNGRPSFTTDGRILVGRPDRDTVTLLNTQDRGELGKIETCPGDVGGDSLAAVGSTVLFTVVCDEDEVGTNYILDADSGLIADSRQGQATGLSPDGNRYVTLEDQADSNLVVRNVTDGDFVTRLDRVSGDEVKRLRWSPDSTMVGGLVDGGLTIWNVSTGKRLSDELPDLLGADVVDFLFTPDSFDIVVTTSDWLIRSISIQTWETSNEHELTADGGYQLGLAAFTSDGASLVAVGAYQGNTAGALHWFDASSLERTHSQVNVHDGAITSFAVDHDASRIATGSSDGVARVWDLTSGDLLHEVPLRGAPVEAIAFWDDLRIASATHEGAILISSIDPDEIVATAQGSLTRGFTLPECSRYGFEQWCPTVADLASRDSREDERSVSGTYKTVWTTEDVQASFREMAAGILEPEDKLPEAVVAFADLIAGAYTFTFADGRFDIALEGMVDTWCTGTYRISDERIWLDSERGECKEGKLFDAGLEVDDEELRLDPADFHGWFFHRLLFASRPLARSG